MIRVEIVPANFAGYNDVINVEWGSDLPELDEIVALDIQRDGGERFSASHLGRLIVQYMPEITPNATIWVNPS